MNTWINEELIGDINDWVGMIYIIHNKTKDKYYIGQKKFFNKTKKRLSRQPTKVERERLERYVVKGKKDKVKEYKKELKAKYKGVKDVHCGSKESNWREYTGSSDELNKDIESVDEINKTIIALCATKWDMNYWETKLQFDYKVLHKSCWYNGIISCRIPNKAPKNSNVKVIRNFQTVSLINTLLYLE